MNQRLVWNFELAPKTPSLPSEILAVKETESLKWEIRSFWPAHEVVTLNTIDDSLLDLANYRQKHREDYYYLLPDGNYNIKRRRNELLYKPLLRKSERAAGFGAKINIDYLKDQPQNVTHSEEYLQKMAQEIAKGGTEVYVKKEAFIYKFATTPTVKLELARIEVLKQIYLSACIEGKSLYLVEKIAEHLLGQAVSCEYVTFLKNILRP